jgi:ubiquinol-cytochrome c reductase cytochrome b subunit
MNWITGALLLGLVLAMAGTGQLLRWDQDGIWTVVVWAKFAERVPLIGEPFARFILAGDTLGAPTLSRFFALHVLVFPALIFLLVGVHLYLVLHHGISEPPEAGRPVDPRTYRQDYDQLLERGRPYWPYGLWREAVAGALVVVAVLLLALIFGPKGPAAPPDPTQVQVVPKPDWFYLWYYTLVWLKPPALETLTMVVLPLGVGVILFLLPLLRGRGERHPGRRPWAVLAVLATVLVFLVLTGFGFVPYWIPEFETAPLTAAELGEVEAPVLAGAGLFYERGCQYCHAVRDRGGAYGPALTDVAKRMSPEEIAVRIVVGIRNMPAYRDMLTPVELEAIVAFLRHLGEGGR